MSVLRLHDTGLECFEALFAALPLQLELVADGADIPGSHWGDDEAGLILNSLYVRMDTPVHSLLHEACHWLLMDETRRASLHTDAGGTSTEENAVCYLQILLAEKLECIGKARMFSDMDAWGYSFRLGSAQRWFDADAEDAIAFLRAHELLHSDVFDIAEKLPHPDAVAGLHVDTPARLALEQNDNR